jgi:hypothetical protein
MVGNDTVNDGAAYPLFCGGAALRTKPWGDSGGFTWGTAADGFARDGVWRIIPYTVGPPTRYSAGGRHWQQSCVVMVAASPWGRRLADLPVTDGGNNALHGGAVYPLFAGGRRWQQSCVVMVAACCRLRL